MKVRGGEVPTSSTSSTSSTPSAAAPAAKGLAQRHTVSSPLTSWQAVGLTANELELDWLAGHVPRVETVKVECEQISEPRVETVKVECEQISETVIAVLQEIMLRYLSSFLTLMSICVLPIDLPLEFYQHILISNCETI